MSLYQVQKLIQAVNRNADARQRFLTERVSFTAEYNLNEEERAAVTGLKLFSLYEMGVHPLLLRPFTIINGISEPDYLQAIREGD